MGSDHAKENDGEGWPTPSHRLKASAYSLSCPGMWDTSISIHELEMRRLSFSKKKRNGHVGGKQFI